LLDRALAQKPRAAELAEKYASSFVFGELLLAIPVFIGWAWYADAHTALWITVALLVITCPCALSLATPTALAASTGALAKDGILISGKQSLETLAQIDDVVFDKTGTLTKGQLSVSRMLSAGRLNEVQALAVAQALEQQSEHPIARAILNHTLLDGPVSALDVKVQQRVNRIGHGVSAQIELDGKTQVWALGKAAFVSEIAGNLPETFAHIDHTGGIIFLGNQSGFQTAFLLEDQIKDSAAEMLQNLKQHGIRLHLLSGDRQAAVAQVAQELGLDAYRAEATPEDKLAYVENLQKQGRKVMMIGDGINDAPVLAQADVSAAVATSADVARDGADVVLLNDDLNVLPVMMEQARRTHQIIRQNLTWASAYNLVAVPLAVFGYV
ncbi:MAG: heavy metal translocating P-type ATPase, partial [Neisseria sp.]|nr:heavy metal translocating P-type ATPase [Neisseria sp.]